MARHKEAPFHVRSKGGRAILYFATPEGRKLVALGFAFDHLRCSPADRAAALRKGEEKYRELTDGRVVDEDKRVRTSQTFGELYGQYQAQFEPLDSDDVNTRKAKRSKCIVLEAYASNVMKWACDEAKRPDGSKRWRGDARTPLQRLLAEGGPGDYLAYRLTLVQRKTMRKEKSNLVQFFAWAKAAGYVSSVPAVELPTGKGKIAQTSGRGVDIHLTIEESRRIVAIMPEWSTRTSRDADEENQRRFLVRPFFEFMSLTGLRPVTLARLESGRNWLPGSKSLILDNADDKAKYGRSFPLSTMAAELLEKYAPRPTGSESDPNSVGSGHIFGHHDYRKFVRAAAALVLDERRAALFGSYHLRHFMGTFLASRTKNIAAGMFLMGHTEAATFSGYVHAREEDARALVEQTAPELRKAARSAEKWAAAKVREEATKEKRAKNSDPIRIRSSSPAS